MDYCDHAAAIAAKDSVIEELTNSLREVGEINSNARAEIARLKAENVCRDYRHHDFLAYTERFLDRQEEILAEGQAIIDAKEAEIIRLRKVVKGVERLHGAVFASDIRGAWQDITDALAELDEVKP